MALIEKIEKLPDTNRCQCGHANAIHYLDSDTDKFYCNYPRCGCAGYEKQQPNFDHVRDIYDLLCIHSTYRKACDGCSTREFINRAVADKTIRLSAQLKASQDEARRYRKALEHHYKELAATAERLEAANAELETAWQLNNRKAHSLFELQADFDAETLRRIDAEKVIDHYGDERHWVHRTVEDYNFSEIDSIFTEKHRTEYGFEKAQQYRKLYPINQEATDAK